MTTPRGLTDPARPTSEAAAPPAVSLDGALRFWSKVDMSAGIFGCWPWTASRTPKGYGRFRIVGHNWRRANRLAWELNQGPIPPGLFVCHHCDNPSCCNPSHLYVGTISDNGRDVRERGPKRTHCKRGHEFSPDNIRWQGVWRICRACERLRIR